MLRAGSFALLTLLIAACSQGAPQAEPVAPVTSSGAHAPDYGPNPSIPEAAVQGIPTIRVARVVGWADGETPRAPEGFVVSRFGGELDHPRRIYVLPNGDVLVAEASTQRARGGFRALAENTIMGQAGALGASANRIMLLRDADGDGDVDQQSVFIDGLNQPFGIALVGGYIYVANTDAIWRFAYETGQTRISSRPERILALPYNRERNGHWTRDLAVGPDGRTLYVSVGSVSNVGDQGMDIERGRATVWRFQPDGSQAQIFASGLRNANGLAFEPQTNVLWAVVNERDMLGDLVTPDYLTSVREGGFYGWPYTYWGRTPDPRFDANERPAELVARAITPDYAVGAHTAPLGLAFYTAESFPERYRGGAFIGQHGSWNRTEFAGYRVIFIPFANGRPNGVAEEFLGGFLNERGEARGRPVSVALDRTGALLVADDAGNAIWRVARAATP